MSDPPEPVDPTTFRRLMSRWATGVAVVTSREGSQDFGLTVNALLSVALEPPLLLISLMQDADTTPVVRRTGRFAVSLLNGGQREVSERFARTSTPREKFADLAVHRSRSGLAWIDGTLAAFDCRVVTELPVADHLLFIGEVEAAEAGDDGAPLLFFRSDYARPTAAGTVKLPPGHQ